MHFIKVLSRPSSINYCAEYCCPFLFTAVSLSLSIWWRKQHNSSFLASIFSFSFVSKWRISMLSIYEFCKQCAWTTLSVFLVVFNFFVFVVGVTGAKSPKLKLRSSFQSGGRTGLRLVVVWLLGRVMTSNSENVITKSVQIKLNWLLDGTQVILSFTGLSFV